jgi:hypothetical protein
MSARLQQPALRPPRGSDCVPDFDLGWRRQDGGTDPFISYVDDDHSVNWSAELEELHEESSREHFIDVWTRRSMLEYLVRFGIRLPFGTRGLTVLARPRERA